MIIDCRSGWFVDVQVVDTAGRPLDGVPVCLSPKSPGFFEPVSFLDRSGTTRPPDGMTRLGPIQDSVERGWALQILGTLPVSERVDVDPRALPANPIRLVMPDFGSVEVRIVPRNGKPIQRSAEVELSSAREGQDLFKMPERIPPGGDKAVFDCVGLGLELRAEVTFEGVSRGFEARGLGPTAPGENVVIQVKFDTTPPRLSGRLIDGDSMPVCDRGLCLSGAVRIGERLLEFDKYPSSDLAGDFFLDIDAPGVSTAPATLLIREYGFEPTLGAAIGFEMNAGLVDLGSVKLGPPELLAAGCVVDDDGLALKRVVIELVPPDRGDGIGWASRSETDENGRFELRGWCSAATIRIAAKTSGFRREQSKCSKGANDVRFQLERIPGDQR